ncbi:MAG: hypothetical protein ACOY93_00180 [Bacillota bacterium]
MISPRLTANCLFQNMYVTRMAEATRDLPPGAAAAARQRGAALDLWETIAQLPAELASLGWK